MVILSSGVCLTLQLGMMVKDTFTDYSVTCTWYAYHRTMSDMKDRSDFRPLVENTSKTLYFAAVFFCNRTFSLPDRRAAPSRQKYIKDLVLALARIK